MRWSNPLQYETKIVIDICQKIKQFLNKLSVYTNNQYISIFESVLKRSYKIFFKSPLLSTAEIKSERHTADTSTA
jgi:hypothetical protein